MIDFVAFAISIVIIIGLVFYLAVLKIKQRRSFQGVLQLVVDKNILLKELSEAKIEIQKLSSPDDGFVKFLSESRDWAYQYIESAQKEIQEVVSVIDAEQKLFSDTRSLKKSDLEDMLNRIMKQSERLKSILPDNNKE